MKKIFLIISILLFFLLILAAPVLAQLQLTDDAYSKTNWVHLNIPLGGISALNLAADPLYWYLSIWYGFVIGAVGILATVMIMWSGFKWLTSRGNATTIANAKEGIWSAIIGLVLAFLSFTILNLINPELLKIKSPILSTEFTDVNNPSMTTGANPSPNTATAATDEQWNRLMLNNNLEPQLSQNDFLNEMYGKFQGSQNILTPDGGQKENPEFTAYKQGVGSFYNSVSGLGANDYVNLYVYKNGSVPVTNYYKDQLAKRGVIDGTNATIRTQSYSNGAYTFIAVVVNKK